MLLRKTYFCILRYIKQANKAPNGEGYTQGRTPKKKTCSCTQTVCGKVKLFTQEVLIEKQVSTMNLSIFLATFNAFLEGGQFEK